VEVAHITEQLRPHHGCWCGTHVSSLVRSRHTVVLQRVGAGAGSSADKGGAATAAAESRIPL
jgi:hypothetical protein